MAIITGTPNHDKKLGTAQADTLTGLDGNDTLAGQSGNDILKGDNGADSLDGGTGNDQLSGGTGNDVLLGGSGNDSLNGAEDSDTLDGGAGADTLDGGTGADNMTGGDGNDLYFVDNIGDRVIETAAQKSTDSVLSTIRYVLPDFVEHLQLLGDSALSGTGNALKNRITGNAADNLLLGMDGQDTLSGSDGADTLDGGSGADSLVGGSGDDTYLIGNTEDKIVETADGGDSDRIVSSISYSLIRHIETLTLTGTANLQGEGNDAANLLEGNSGANNLSGGAGDDTLPGHDGNDTLAGGSGDDQLQGGTGDDTAFYSNPLEGYQLSFDDESQEWTVTDIDPGNGDEGTDSLTGIERAQFADQTLNLSAKPTLTAADVTQAEGTGSTDTSLKFTLSLSEASALPVSVDYTLQAGAAEAGTDFTASNGTLTFAPGVTRQTLSVPVKADNVDETDETFSLNLGNAVGASLTKTQATATLRDDDTAVLTAVGVSFTEGDSGSSNATVTVSLSTPSSQTVTVDYATQDGTAKTGLDYTATAGSLRFAPGITRQDILIPILGEQVDEADEIFTLILSRAENARLDAAASRIVLTLSDNDPTPTLSLTPVTIDEGQNGTGIATLTALLSNPSAQVITLDYATLDETALAGSDYQAASGTLRFAPGETSKTLTLSVLGDSLNEADKTFGLLFSNPQNVVVDASTGKAAVTIKNDDAQPSLAISPLTLTEGNTGTTLATLEVSLSAVSGQTVSVAYTTANGTANAGIDYTATSGTLSFAPGTTRQTITLPILGETLYEPDETFNLNLSNPQNAGLNPDRSAALITLANDDAIPALSLTSIQINEDGGNGKAVLAVNLSAASGVAVSVDYTTADGTALAGKDYTAQTGTITFAAGEIVKTFSIPIISDTLNEIDENFSVSLANARNANLNAAGQTATVLIRNDDPQPVVSVVAASINEGQSGSNMLNTTVNLSVASGQPVTVAYATTDGTATSGTDYTAQTGTLVFNPGETSKTISIPISGDTLNEADETFTLALTNPQNASLTAPADKVTLTIKNDDATPVLSIADTRVTEGSSGTTQASVTVSLSAASGQVVTARYATADATAKAAGDYTSQTGTVRFAAGETSQTLTIPVTADSEVETDETFTVNLTAPQNASISPTGSKATVTISNDDIALPTLSLADNETTEGNSGSHDLQLTATLSTAFDRVVTVNYTTVDDTATAGDDYTAQSGTLTFAPGTTRQSLSIPVAGDSVQESSETFRLVFSNPQNLTVNGPSMVYITNDDLDGVTFEGFDGGGSEGNDDIPGSVRNDRLIGLAGDDTLNGEVGRDLLLGGPGADTLYGGNDEADDWIDGGTGNDVLNAYKDGKRESWVAQPVLGNDTLLGGAGDDRIYHRTTSGGYKHLIEGGDGNDTIYGSTASDDYGYNYAFGDDTLRGGNGDDVIGIGGYMVVLTDYDDYYTPYFSESGNDLIEGGAGRDTLYGGYGDDTFVFKTGDSGVGTGNRDRIMDFNVDATGEVLDLHEVSPSGSTLTFQKMAAFTAANQVRYTLDSANKLTIVQINLDPNLNTAEMEIELVGFIPLNASEFLLTPAV